MAKTFFSSTVWAQHVIAINLVFVRNSLPTRSSLDWGVMTWMLKVEEGGRCNKSDNKGNNNGLYRQCYEVLSIPWTLRDVGTLLKCTNDLNSRDADRTIYGYGCTLYGKHTVSGHTVKHPYFYVLEHLPVQYGDYYGRCTGLDGCTAH